MCLLDSGAFAFKADIAKGKNKTPESCRFISGASRLAWRANSCAPELSQALLAQLAPGSAWCGTKMRNSAPFEHTFASRKSDPFMRNYAKGGADNKWWRFQRV